MANSDNGNSEIKNEKNTADKRRTFFFTLPANKMAEIQPDCFKWQFSTSFGHTWELQINLTKNEKGRTISCNFILKREDMLSGPAYLTINVMVWCEHIDYATVKAFRLEMLPRSEVRKCIADVLPNLKWKEADQDMTLNTQVIISPYQ